MSESSKKSHKILALWTMLVLATAALALGSAVKADAQEGGTAPQPTISSDKADYPPGGTVVLTGSHWQPGESVNIFVNDDAGKTWSRNVDVTADESGNVRDEFQLPDWFVAQYSVKATGARSGEATTTFTDAAAQLQGQSNPPCSSGGQCDSGWEAGNLKGWQELDEIPLRLKFPATGTFTIKIDFDHFQTSSGAPGIQNLYDWSPASGVTLQGQPTLTTGLSGGKWRYTLTANVTNPNAILNFKGNLAAGAHNFTGSSLALGGSDVGGTVQVTKPAARPGNPDLVVNKTGPTTAGRDEVVTYTLNYQNKSTATSGATGVQLTDVLPSGVTYVAGSCSGTCTVSGNEVVWNLGSLVVGGSGSRTLQVRIPADAAFGAQFTDQARIRSAENDVTPADNDDSLTTTVAFNRGPVAVNDSYNVDEDETLTVSDGPNDVLANDTDPDNDPLTVTGNTQPAHGSATVNANGSFTYTPSANYNGPDSFNYTVSDGKGGTATGTVDITVDPVNDTPTITPNIADKTILEDADTGDISFTVGDADSAAGSLIVTASSSDTTLVPNDNANLILGGSGANRTIKVKPAADRFGGPATITLTVSDGSESATETFDVNVTPVNDAPSFDVPANAPLVNEDAPSQTVANFATDIFVGPFETGQTITEFQVTNNSNPSLFSAGPAIDPSSGDLTYTPAANAFGTADVTVRAKDSGGTSNGGVDTSTAKTFAITANSVNDDPNAVDDSANAEEDGPAVDIDVLANDDDGPDTGETLTVTSVTQPPAGEGSVEIIENGQKVRFTPDADFEGSSTSFDYTISDGDGGTDTATVTVNISNQNDPPVLDLNGEDAGRDFSATFTEDDAALSIVGTTGNGALSVTDADDENMESATATLTNRPDGNAETLSIDASAVPSISVTDYDSSSGILSLSGTATKAQYEQVLRTVKYDNTSQNPSTQSRVIEFVVNDGDADSLKPNSTVAVISVNDDPVIDVIENGNEAPEGSVDGGPVDEGSPATIVVSASDPDNDPGELLYSFDCDDDGTFETANPQPGDDTAQCTFDDNGTYTVNVKVADGAGQDAGTATSSTQVEVINVDPEGNLGNDGPIDEGDTVRISFSGQNDPSSVDTDAGFHYAFDCAGGSLAAATYQNSGAASFVDCTFNNDGTKTVSARIIDKDDGFSQYTTDVTVDNAAPRVTLLSGPDLVKESTTAERTYTFNASDAGDDELTINVDCGENGDLVDANGADPGGTFTYDPTTGDGSFKCVFPDGGPNGSTRSNVTVRATDSDGATDADNQVVIVTVENDNPQATFNAPGSVNEGDDIDLSLTDATDPAGSNDTLEYAFKCGDADWTGFGPASTHACPTNDDGQVIVRGQVRDEDGGQSEVYEKTVTVNNVAPTANDDQMNTTELLNVTSNLLDNDTDPGNDLDSASLEILDANAVPPSPGPLGGVVTISALLDGNVTYAPNPGFVNVDSFRYEVCDDDGDCSSANVDVTVGPVNCDAQGVIRGTPGKDVLRGTPGNDVICAFAGNDRVYGGGGNDLLVGDAGLDRMWGEDGGDVLRGGADTDALDAGLGTDYLNGDTGRDVLMGRGGADFLEMRDGSAGDAGNGGAGTDTCAKDQGDRTVSCERQ